MIPMWLYYVSLTRARDPIESDDEVEIDGGATTTISSATEQSGVALGMGKAGEGGVTKKAADAAADRSAGVAATAKEAAHQDSVVDGSEGGDDENDNDTIHVFPRSWTCVHTPAQKARATLVLLAATTAVIAWQIGTDFYYLIVLGENILDN